MYPNGSYSNESWSNVSSFSSQPGPIHTRVTRAYAPEALSTGGDCHGTSWTAINYTKLYSPEPDYEVATEAGCSDYSQFNDAGYFLAGEFLLSMPADLSLVDPLWSTCTPESGYDPPRALSPAIALIPTPTSDPVTQPMPASSPQHSLPVQTPTSELDAPAEGKTPADEASGYEDYLISDAILETTEVDDPREAIMVIGTHTVLVDPSSTSFDGAPLDPDGSPVTVSGAAAMLQGTTIIVGDAIIHVPSPAADNPIVIAGHTMTPLAEAVAIDGMTLHAGDSPRTISGTIISLARNDNLILNPTVRALPTPPPPAAGILFEGKAPNIDGQAFEVLSDGISIAGTTLTPGGPAATVSGTTISLDITALFIDSSTIPISLPRPTSFTTTIGGHVITAAPSSVILQGTSLEPGAPGMTIDNTFISLNEAGSLIIGSRTIALGGAALTTRIGDELITAAPTGVQIAGSTLLPGAAGWTIDGTSISLDVMGDVIIGAKTIGLDGAGVGMGGLIMAGFGPKGGAGGLSSSSGSASGPAGDAETEGVFFEGRAGRLEAVRFWTVAAVVAAVVLV